MRQFRIILSLVFLFIGGFALSTIVMSMSGGYNYMGSILIEKFSYMSIGIPFFYFWYFVIFFTKKHTLEFILWPTISIIPFIIFTLGLKLQFWNGDPLTTPPLTELYYLFGEKGTIMFLYLVGIFVVFSELLLKIILNQNTHHKKTTHSYAHVHNYTPHMQSPSKVQQSAHRPYQQYAAPAAPKCTANTEPQHTYSQQQQNDLKEEKYFLVFNKKKKSERIITKETSEEDVIEDEINSYSLHYDSDNVLPDTQDHNNKDDFISDEDDNTKHDIAFNIDKQENTAHNDTHFRSYPHDEEGKESEESEEHHTYYRMSDDPTEEEPTVLSRASNVISRHIDDDYVENEISTLSENINEDTTIPQAHDSMTDDMSFDSSAEPWITNDDVHSTAPPKKKKAKIYKIPIIGLLDPHENVEETDTRYNKEVGTILENTLKEFNIDATVISILPGPVVTLYEILPAPGVRLRRIVELGDNIALRLAAPSIRIVAPIPGKEAVGIEVPNDKRNIVSFAELISEKQFYKKEYALPIALGKNIANKNLIIDLTRSPHLLIAGATGSGKSVCVNAIISSLLYRCTPEDVRLILIDPKIVELSFYNNIAHLLTPVISTPEQSLQALRWCVHEMERRYQQLESLNVREIRSYNEKLKEMPGAHKKIPFLVLIIDEFADLMMTCGKEIEMLVSRLTAKSRAVGIHIVVATQRPSTDVITGLIKSNIPTRISFMVTSKTDSRIILDMNGAEALLGKGDMLYSSSSDPFPERLQGPYLAEVEVQRIVSKVKELCGEPEYISDEIFSQNENQNAELSAISDDPLWEKAVEEVVETRKASASHLQRRFKIGYNRAARLVEEMEVLGIIGPLKSGKVREVLADHTS